MALNEIFYDVYGWGSVWVSPYLLTNVSPHQLLNLLALLISFNSIIGIIGFKWCIIPFRYTLTSPVNNAAQSAMNVQNVVTSCSQFISLFCGNEKGLFDAVGIHTLQIVTLFSTTLLKRLIISNEDISPNREQSETCTQTTGTNQCK